MFYTLKINDSEGKEMFISRSSDLDDLYTDIRKFKETPQYTQEHEKELNNLPF